MTLLKSERFISPTMEETPLPSISEDKSCQRHSMSINQDNNSLEIDISPAMRLNSIDHLLPMADPSTSMGLTSSLKTTTWLNIKDTSHLEILSNQSQETQSLCRFHHIMASVMKLTHLVMSTSLLLRSQRLTSSSMLITIRRS